MHTCGAAGLGRDTRRSPGRLPAAPVPGSATTAGDDQEKHKREHAAEQERRAERATTQRERTA
ncbi:hypothetical protein GCM10027073_38050 [Streptomyces chlorus]